VYCLIYVRNPFDSKAGLFSELISSAGVLLLQICVLLAKMNETYGWFKELKYYSALGGTMIFIVAILVAYGLISQIISSIMGIVNFFR
jgi:hypothetical protein